MAAFVGAIPTVKASTSSTFFGIASEPSNNDRHQTTVLRNRRTTTMKILDGLDTVNQDSYTFSRYILGPFQPKILYSTISDGDREMHIKEAYRHIFGNAYIMEEERAELAIAESQYKIGNITAREFVRALGKSSAYKTRFFEGASQYRFIELNYMHFLGRSPDSKSEVSEHIQRYNNSGVDADIDSYIDSEEYSSVFGDDNIPFLRFRGAYTPCDSFNKQCALKGGWANSDKAMGGAALSGYNGSDGKQFCTRIDAYVAGATTPYEEVAENTPLKSTAPNWYACPNPALEPTPTYVSVTEVRALEQKLATLQEKYNVELERKTATGKDALAPFRSMVSDMAPMLERGFAYSGGDANLANPFAKLATEESPLIDGGCKSSDYKRYMSQMENDTLSRIEKEIEETKAILRVFSKALENSSPITPTIELPGQVDTTSVGAATIADTSRPRVKVAPRKASTAPKKIPVKKEGMKVGPISLPPMPNVSLPEVSVPKLSLPDIKLPFSKKDE